MDSAHSSSENDVFQIGAGLKFHKTIDFDKRALKKALYSGGKEVIKAARRLVARSAISSAGEFPGRDSGRLRRAIGIVKTGGRRGTANKPPGGYVKVGVRTIKDQFFYPAILHYGSRKQNIAKRGNYIVAAAKDKREVIKNTLRAALKNALVPR